LGLEDCAPSLMPDLAGTIWGLAGMMAQGYVVVATDYPGLGVPGMIHPYLIGASEGRAVLDSVRAARDLPDAGASNRLAVWGHSQGGQASLYTGELAASYAPDLKLVGVAAAAPATYLVELFDADKTSSEGKELTAMTVLSWSRLESLPATTIVEPDAVPAFEKTARACIESLAEFEAINKDEHPLQIIQFLKANPSETEPWKGIMLHNTPGQAPARRCSSPKAPPIRRSGPRSPSNSAIICAAKARVSISSSCLACRIPSPPRTAHPPRWPGWASASGGVPAPSSCGR
jgi:pimeloyl-ACP methyl ester carboxylesterase